MRIALMAAAIVVSLFVALLCQALFDSAIAAYAVLVILFVWAGLAVTGKLPTIGD